MLAANVAGKERFRGPKTFENWYHDVTAVGAVGPDGKMASMAPVAAAGDSVATGTARVVSVMETPGRDITSPYPLVMGFRLVRSPML
jgi:hypothetical protein